LGQCKVLEGHSPRCVLEDMPATEIRVAAVPSFET